MIEDDDAIGNLIDIGEVMGRQKHRHFLTRDVRNQRLQDFFGHCGIET